MIVLANDCEFSRLMLTKHGTIAQDIMERLMRDARS